MNQIKVYTINTPDLSLIDMAAIIGVTFIRKPLDEIMRGMTKERAKKIISNVVWMDHMSALEHMQYTFVVEGASRVFLAQVTRHRMASYTSGSQQYQLHGDFDYLLPEGFESWETSAQVNYRLVMDSCNEIYKHLLEAGVNRDDARYVLPGACRVNSLVISMNVRELFSFFKQRICKRNTAETMLISRRMLSIVYRDYPDLFKLCGPACVTCDKCDQGSKTCGKPYMDFEEMLHGS